jgi:hypothetical protein
MPADCYHWHANSPQRYPLFPIDHCRTRTYQSRLNSCFQLDCWLARRLWRIFILNQYRMRTLEKDDQATLATGKVLPRQIGHSHQHFCCLVHDSASYYQLLPNVRYRHCQDNELRLRYVWWSGYHIDCVLHCQREARVQRSSRRYLSWLGRRCYGVGFEEYPGYADYVCLFALEVDHLSKKTFPRSHSQSAEIP